MNRTFRKHTLREITGTKSRFLSIFFIVAIGVAFFTGVKGAAPDMRLSADRYYDDNHLMDLKLLSTTGFTADDIEALAVLGEDVSIYPAYYIDTLTTTDSGDQVARLYSFDDCAANNSQNELVLDEGRFPVKADECVIDSAKSLSGTPLKIGDTITFTSGVAGSALGDSLENVTYTIVGTFHSSMYIDLSSRGSTTIGNGSIHTIVYVPESNFTSDYYTTIYLSSDELKEELCYSDTYEEKLEELITSVKAIASVQEEKRYGEVLAALPQTVWYTFTRDDNPGYSEYGENAERINNIAKVFPVFFLLVAALVCLTTMSRMIEEERTQIGTLKALGYSGRTIASQYLIYAISATISGSVFGVLIGMKIFPYVIIKAYSMLYAIPEFVAPYDFVIGGYTLLVAVVAVTLTVLFSLHGELKEQPASLMRPKTPKAGKRILLERITGLWKHLSFAWKVTLRNMFRYKKRMLMTIIGISGCTALTLTGFALHDSISDVVEKQYVELTNYTGLASCTGSDAAALEEVNQVLSSHDLSYEYIYQKSYRFDSDTAHLDAYLCVPEQAASMGDYITLRNRQTQKTLALAEDTILINEKMAALLDVKVGDTVDWKLSDTEVLTLEVAGIYENYAQHYVYMTPTTYEKLLGVSPTYNMIFFMGDSLDSTDKEDALSEELISLSCIQGVKFNSNISETFSQMLASLNLVIVVLIVSAGVLAFVVLYNLTNINITERIREISTIKVLGFYDMEVDSYIFRENILLSILGDIAGLGLGILLSNYVIRTAEIDMVMFGRDIHPLSFLISFLITLVFTVLVALYMHRYLIRVNMVEALKSVE